MVSSSFGFFMLLAVALATSAAFSIAMRPSRMVSLRCDAKSNKVAQTPSPSSPSAASTEGGEDQKLKKQALELLDCLTSPRDLDDPQYDVSKDMRRDEILRGNDYSALKVALRERGLRTSGDKMEMIVRLLLHIIDPSINYSQMTGKEVNLQYVNAEDVSANKVKVVPEGERESDPSTSDAEDMMALRRRPGQATNKPQVVMDGLTRRELEFPPVRVRRPLTPASAQEDEQATIRAYVVGGRDVLRTWERQSTVVVLLPDEAGWRDKAVRVFADELSFFNQAIVVVPDLHRGQPWAGGGAEEGADRGGGEEYARWLAGQRFDRVFDDVVAALRFSKRHFDCRALALAGLGCGGGWALQAACALSDIQSAAAVEAEAEEGTDDMPGAAGPTGRQRAEQEAISVNPFAAPQRSLRLGSGDITSEAEAAQREVEATERMLDLLAKKMGRDAAAAGGEVTGDGDGAETAPEIDLDLSLGADDVRDGGDINDLLKLASDDNALDKEGLEDEEDEATADDPRTEEVEDVHVDLERRRQALDADLAARAADIAQRRAADSRRRALVAEYAELSLRDLARLEPRAVLALCPSLAGPVHRDGHGDGAAAALAAGAAAQAWDEVGRALRVPACVVFGEADASPGAGPRDAARLDEQLRARLAEVADYSIRVYEGRGRAFAHRPQNELDARCAQETVAIGAIWLDVFCRDAADRTDGAGLTRLTDDSYAFVAEAQMRQPARPSSVAAFLHDDPDFFKNDRLKPDNP